MLFGPTLQCRNINIIEMERFAAAWARYHVHTISPGFAPAENRAIGLTITLAEMGKNLRGALAHCGD